MDSVRRRLVLAALAVVAGLLPACEDNIPVEKLPAVRDTLAEVGRRLIRERPVDEVSAVAARGDRVLAALTPGERDALGRDHVRFEVDRPVIVEVAASERALPFWLSDQGFRRTPTLVEVGGKVWPVYGKRFPKGWVGLGVNALDRSAADHYVAFVRPADGGELDVPSTDPDRWRMVRAREGVSAALDAESPVRRLPAFLRGSLLVQVRRDQRHATALARGRVWKTHVPSSPTPDQVVISFGPDPARSLVWTWRTGPEADAGSTVLRLAPASGRGPADPRSIRTVTGGSRRIEMPDLLNDPTILRHCVRVDDLQPGTLYAYSLGSGPAAAWTPWRTVRTAPARPRSYSFLYLGDAQCGLEAWGKLLAAARRRHPEAGFLLLAGDLVDRGNERTNWDHFFLRGAHVLDELPFLPCAGNHEYLDRGPWLYTEFFELPRNGPAGIAPDLVYGFEYGNTFVAALDSTLATTDRRLARVQAEWLDRALAKSRATWKLVMFHHPVYASHVSRTYPSLREDWVPVFDKHHVDLVLQGHDHAYLRTYPMHADRRVATSAEGTTYIVSVSGEKFCEQAPRGYTEVGMAGVATYQTIDVDVPEDRLTYRAWDLDGREVDRLVIEKPVQVVRK